MKKIRTLLFLPFFFILSAVNSQHCATTFSTAFEEINFNKKSIPSTPDSEKVTGVEVRVIIHQVLPEEIPFFSFEAIADQLETLNENFQKKDINIRQLPENLRELAAVSAIHFSIATTLENGEPIDGIINVRTQIPAIGRLTNQLTSASNGSSPINPIRYLNIYICEISETTLGYSATPDLTGQENDIIAIDYRRFGINSTYNSTGKTLTHEVGHYLGLDHPWGQRANECDEDDGISDTPFQRGPIYTCEKLIDCSDQLSGSNFMDYSPDCCLLYFTAGQFEKMNYVLNELRTGLIENFKPEPTNSLDFSLFLYPNPARNLLRVRFGVIKPSEISIYDFSGKLLMKNLIAPSESQSIFCLDRLPSGTYLIAASKESLRETERFIHIH